MKNGKLEPEDADTLMAIYRKIDIWRQELKEPLTTYEMVLIFALSKWIRENVKEDKAR